MNRSVVLLCAVLVGECSVRSTFAADEKPQAGKTICDKQFKIVSPDGEHELGTYSIKATTKEAGSKIEIVESVALDYRGKKVEMKSVVIYDNASPASPLKGTAETRLDGKACMKGTVTFSGKTVDIEGTGLLNPRTGAAIDPPRKFEMKGQPVAEGVLVFQSALPAIGPRILPKEGELKNIVFVEFPDDLGAPELVTFKEGYRLVREKPDENGEYVLKMYSPFQSDSISQIRFSKDDQIVSFASHGKLKLVEVQDKKD